MGGEGSQNRVLCSGWRLLSRARRESRGQGGRLFAPPLFLGRGKEEDTWYEDEGLCVATFFLFFRPRFFLSCSSSFLSSFLRARTAAPDATTWTCEPTCRSLYVCLASRRGLTTAVRCSSLWTPRIQSADRRSEPTCLSQGHDHCPVPSKLCCTHIPSGARNSS